jgi:hypothetical protein
MELSNIPVRFSSGKTLSHNAYIWLRPSSAFITPREKGQEEISRPEFMSIRNRRADLRNSRRENGNPIQKNDG